MKEKAIEIVKLQYELKIKLIDDLFTEITELKNSWIRYYKIAEKIGVNQSDLSQFINWEFKYIQRISNKTLNKWLTNLTK